MHWAAKVVWISRLVVNSQVVIDRGQQVLGGQGTLDRILTLTVGSTNDLSHPKATTGHQCRVGLRPMISSV